MNRYLYVYEIVFLFLLWIICCDKCVKVGGKTHYVLLILLGIYVWRAPTHTSIIAWESLQRCYINLSCTFYKCI